MIILIMAIAAGFGSFTLAYIAGDFGIVWSLVCGFVCFGVVQGVAGFLIRKRMTHDMERVQAILANGQKQLQAKTQRWQFRPPSSVQAAQREMFNDMKVYVREALAETETLKKYRMWVPMIDRQMATAQLQLNWMIKEFDTVDALLPKAILMDPSLVAIKMARMYMLEAKTEDIEKVYRKAVRRLRYNQNVLLAATMSWIQVKRDQVDAAFQTLTEALKKSDNTTLKRNHETLMNNRKLQFTNSGLGDTWYALYLEEAKMHAPRQRSAFR